MNDFLKTLLNIRSLRAALRELSYEQLVEAKEKFDEIYAEREQQETKLERNLPSACKNWLSLPSC